MPSGRCTQRPYKLFGYRQSLTYTAALQILENMRRTRETPKKHCRFPSLQTDAGFIAFTTTDLKVRGYSPYGHSVFQTQIHNRSQTKDGKQRTTDKKPQAVIPKLRPTDAKLNSRGLSSLRNMTQSLQHSVWKTGTQQRKQGNNSISPRSAGFAIPLNRTLRISNSDAHCKCLANTKTRNRRDAACCVRNGNKGYMPSGRCTQRPYKLFGYRQSLTYHRRIANSAEHGRFYSIYIIYMRK